MTGRLADKRAVGLLVDELAADPVPNRQIADRCRSRQRLNGQVPAVTLRQQRRRANASIHFAPTNLKKSGCHHPPRQRQLGCACDPDLNHAGEQLRRAATVAPEPAAVTPAPAITLSLDSTYIRSCHAGERRLEVRVGNAEAPEGGRQVFGAVANAGTDIAALIRRTLDTLGRTSDTALTAFTDGCSGLRTILAAAGVASPPSLDWFHLSTRLQHAKQVAEGLPAEEPDQPQAKAEIVTEVERLRWRAWNGKAKDARITLKRLRTLLPALEREPVRKLKRALRAVDRYLRSQSAWLVNYAERWRAGLRVGTSLTEGTANFLVNRRMAKSQQMRWSRRGADLLLQVRCAVCNGALGTGFGQRFQAAKDPHPPAAIAA